MVIGASAGIGRATALRAVQAGARTVVGARRQAALDELVDEAGGGTALALDLRDVDSCHAFAAQAAASLGGPIDAVLFTAGMSPMARIEDLSAQDWIDTFTTNVVAFNVMAAALLPSLAPNAFFAALSSESVDAPRFAMGAYGASKAALEHSIRGWRLEHPEVRFSTITVGSTVPTGFGDNFGAEILTEALNVWAKQGLAQFTFMKTDDVAELLVELTSAAIAHPEIGMERMVLRPPSGITDSVAEMQDVAADLRQ